MRGACDTQKGRRKYPKGPQRAAWVSTLETNPRREIADAAAVGGSGDLSGNGRDAQEPPPPRVPSRRSRATGAEPAQCLLLERKAMHLL